MNDDDIGDAIELFESAYHIVPSYDSETGNTSITKPDAPKFRTIRRLKQASPDYRTGAVKVYTAEEIKEYEYARSKQLS